MKTIMWGSYFAANIFLKEISDFISSATTSGITVDGLTNAAYGDLIMSARTCMQEWVDAGRPETGFQVSGVQIIVYLNKLCGHNLG